MQLKTDHSAAGAVEPTPVATSADVAPPNYTLFPLPNYRITPPVIAPTTPSPRTELLAGGVAHSTTQARRTRGQSAASTLTSGGAPRGPLYSWLAPETDPHLPSATSATPNYPFPTPGRPEPRPASTRERAESAAAAAGGGGGAVPAIASPSVTDGDRLGHGPERSAPLGRGLMTKLDYEIVDYSSYNAEFYPHYIKVNQPTAGRSRWSSLVGDQHQYLTLKLDRPSLLQCVTFGKFSRNHICNLKEFRILAAATENHWVEILLSGLRNDSEPETFTVRNTLHHGTVPFPVLWIKVIPLMAYEHKFNFTIWYLELRGSQDPAVVQPLLTQYQRYCERTALRLCLKAIHQYNPDHYDPRAVLGPVRGSDPLTVQLEDPLVTDLRGAVTTGRFDRVEALLARAQTADFLHDYIRRCPYTADWAPVAVRPDEIRPEGRGAHQVCVDEAGEALYLFGGWSGTSSLSDFWRFDLRTSRWELLSPDTAQQGGPGPRHYHSMCFDPHTRTLFVLGRYVDPEHRTRATLENDFYAYHLDSPAPFWERLSANTELDGGPRLSFDFELSVDPTPGAGALYAFGGRTIGADAYECVYSGLYRYHLATRTWTVLRPDALPSETDIALRARLERSMLFHTGRRQLLIVSAQRDATTSSEFSVYDIASDTVFEKATPSPATAIVYDKRYTHRASYDEDRDEVYVFTGRTFNQAAKSHGHDGGEAVSTLWCYHVPTERWSRIYTAHARSGCSDEGSGGGGGQTDPTSLASSVGASATTATGWSSTRPPPSAATVLGTSAVPAPSTATAASCSTPAALALPVTASPRLALGVIYPRCVFYLNSVASPDRTAANPSGASEPPCHASATASPFPLTPAGPTRSKAGTRGNGLRATTARATADPANGAAGQHGPTPPGPEARIAHQFVYHQRTRTHYLFGGASFSRHVGDGYLGPGTDPPVSSTDHTPPAVASHVYSFQSAGGGRSATSFSTHSGHHMDGAHATATTATCHPGNRLNDFWRLELRQPTADDVVRRMQFLVRCQIYLEMCLAAHRAPDSAPSQACGGLVGGHTTSEMAVDTDQRTAGGALAPHPQTTVRALKYLQTELADLVDPNDPAQVERLHRLPLALLDGWPRDPPTQDQLVYHTRRLLFDDLMAFLPEGVKQPESNLMDMVVPWLEARPGTVAEV
ncbi:hypothetical protein IWQ60_009050 [Tieghemiomyces parasiticus]|uniref:Muskelin N-terminal domain-containing protein n=1 Tax=Tieghemiomyces parasiticus TaxID=78921 RepID=A0A9W8DLU6_9FUNG|nr:hypothetical protein IWQ60_009050 [Tieghemiomyces parasiticus]